MDEQTSLLETRLPMELRIKIVSYLNIDDLVNLSYTNSKMHKGVYSMMRSSQLHVSDHDDGPDIPHWPVRCYSFANTTLLLRLVLEDSEIAESVRTLSVSYEDRNLVQWVWDRKKAELTSVERAKLEKIARNSHALNYGNNDAVTRLTTIDLNDKHDIYEPANRCMDLVTVLLALLPNLTKLELKIVKIGTPLAHEVGTEGFEACADMVRRVRRRVDAGQRDMPLCKLKYLYTEHVCIELMACLLVMPVLKLAHLKHSHSSHRISDTTLADWPRSSKGKHILSPVEAIIVDGGEWLGVEHAKFIMSRLRGPAVIIHNAKQNGMLRAMGPGRYFNNVHWTSATKLVDGGESFTYSDYWHPMQDRMPAGFNPRSFYGPAVTWDLDTMHERFELLAKPWLQAQLPDIMSYIVRYRTLLGLTRLQLASSEYLRMIKALTAKVAQYAYEREHPFECDFPEHQIIVKAPLDAFPTT